MNKSGEGAVKINPEKKSYFWTFFWNLKSLLLLSFNLFFAVFFLYFSKINQSGCYI
jgi:hypothetical protein